MPAYLLYQHVFPKIDMAITLTDSAANRVKNHLVNHDTAAGLRLGVKTTGCSGYAYVIDYADKIEEADHIFETNGIKVIVDQQSLGFIDGTEIDYQEDGLGATFKFRNPNVTAECGCGESFTTEKE